MNTVPRTLFLSYSPPDGRYTVIRRIVERFPAGQIMWASVLPSAGPLVLPFSHKAFVPKKCHWRLARQGLNHLYEQEFQAGRIAGDVADWVKDFRPQVIWALAEQGSAHLGYHLHHLLNLPVHAMVQDAHETAVDILPKPYYPIYSWSVRRFLGTAATVDAICAELLDWTCSRYPNLRGDPGRGMVFPPSIERDIVDRVPQPGCYDPKRGVRRIGICGSKRASREQWGRFVNLLGRLPFKIEIDAFVFRDAFHEVPLPSNVTVQFHPFAASEEAVIQAFHASGVHACYLGLWKEPERNLFSRTSLSAKLTTYTAARLPVIVDGPENASAWRLVQQYGAGILYAEDEAAAFEHLSRLFSKPAEWRLMSEGAGRMCAAEFDLDTHVEKFFGMLRLCAGARA